MFRYPSLCGSHRGQPPGTFLALITLAEQQKEDSRQQYQSHNRSKAKCRFSGNKSAQLVDDQAHHISEHAHIADGESGPSGVVHFPFDSAHGGETGGAEQVEDHEAVGGKGAEVRSHHSPDLLTVLADFTSETVKSCQRSNHVLLGGEANEGGHGGFPGHVTRPAQGIEDPGNRVADGGQQGGIVVLHRAKRAAGEAVALEEPQHDGGRQDHRPCPFDEGPAPLPGGPEHVAGGGSVVGGQLHDEGGGLPGKGFELFQHDAGDHHGGDADEEGRGGDQGRASEHRPGEQADDGHFGPAGDEAGGHDGHLPVPVLLDGPGGHDAGDAAAGGHQHGDEALAGEAKAAEDTVHDESDTGHVAHVLQDSQQKEQHQHLRHEAQHRAHAGHDAVLDQAVEPAALGHAQSAQNGVKQAGDHLAEEVVVGPVGAPGADADAPLLSREQTCRGSTHSDGIDQEHDQGEDGQCQNPVGDDLVDFVGDGEAVPGGFLPHRAGYHSVDVSVPLIGDDALGVIVQLSLASSTVILSIGISRFK